MSISSNQAQEALRQLNEVSRSKSLGDNLASIPREELLTLPSVPGEEPYSQEGRDQRLNVLRNQLKQPLTRLGNPISDDQLNELKGNIENFVGMTEVPTGVIGPLCVNGSAAKGDFYVPLATTEGALVASYNRGVKACRESGGVRSLCLIESVQRSPLFRFKDLTELGRFVFWVLEQKSAFEEITSKSSKYARLQDMTTTIEGNQLILTFEYYTGDAAGQNMVTFCTQAICDYIIKETPQQPKEWFIEGNYSGDKKATARSFGHVRGKKVTAEVLVPKDVVHSILKATPEKLESYWKASATAVVQSGAIGIHGHISNGLTAIFMACGQDVACISEASVGMTRMEVDDNGDLYACVTLPNLIVGTVGGGTHLGTQRECLEMMDCLGEGKSRKFAEICGAVILAGELSIAAALAMGHFSQAHQQLGRS